MDPNVQEQICDYHGFLEAALGSEEFGTSLNWYDYSINDKKEGTTKDETYEKEHKGLPYSPEIDDIMFNRDK